MRGCVWLELACRAAQMADAGPMIPICDDQVPEGPARAQGTRRAGRGARGYPSDLTDAQWQVIAPYLPPGQPGRRGRPLVALIK